MPWINSSSGFLPTWSLYSTKPTSITPNTSPQNVESSIHARWITFAPDRNVVVLRTFSKAHGLAGIRVGYAIAPAELTAYFAQVQDVFAISAIAQAAAIAAMDDTEHMQRALRGNDEQAARMERELTALGYEVSPTWTNFVALNVGEDAREFARRLRGKGVLVRPLSVWGAPKSIRVTLGTPEQNQLFVRALASMK